MRWLLGPRPAGSPEAENASISVEGKSESVARIRVV
jgi:hypothetical protein